MKINTNQTNLSSVPTNQSTHLKSTDLYHSIHFTSVPARKDFRTDVQCPYDIPVTDL